MRWALFVVVLLIALVIAIHISGPAPLAAALTPAVGIVLAVLAAWTLKARR
jgi:hypothetical protein